MDLLRYEQLLERRLVMLSFLVILTLLSISLSIKQIVMTTKLSKSLRQGMVKEFSAPCTSGYQGMKI